MASAMAISFKIKMPLDPSRFGRFVCAAIKSETGPFGKPVKLRISGNQFSLTIFCRYTGRIGAGRVFVTIAARVPYQQKPSKSPIPNSGPQGRR